MRIEIKDKYKQLVSITSDKIKTSTYTENTSNTKFDIGCIISTSYDFSLFNINNEFSNINFENNELELYKDNGDRLGHFNILKVTKQGSCNVMETLDNTYKLKEDWNGMAFPCTVFELTLNICNQCNVSIGTTKDEMINGDLIITSEEELQGHTCQEIIAEIARVNGGYALFKEDGKLYFLNYDFSKSKKDLTMSDVSSFSMEEVDTERQGIVIVNGEQEYFFGETTNAFVIDNSPICKYLSEEDLNKCGNNIFNKIKTISYRAMSFTTKYEYEYYGGMVGTIVDKNGFKHNVVFTEMEIKNNYTCDIKCYGDAKNQEDATTYETFRKSGTSSTSGNGNTSEKYAKCCNHQIINAKSGTYTIVSKKVENINYYTKVDLQFTTNFYYNDGSNNGEILTFDVYANDIRLPQRFPVVTHNGVNLLSFSFLADIAGEKECVYSVKATIENNCELLINKSQAVLTLLVLNGFITDKNMTDQYIVEKVESIKNEVFNTNRFSIKSMYENIDIIIPLYVLDISKSKNGSVMCSIYENGECTIEGNGETYNKTLLNQISSTFGEDAKSQCKSIIRNVYISNSSQLTINGGLFNGFKSSFENVILSGGGNIVLNGSSFCNLSIDNFQGEQKITKMGANEFANANINTTLDLSSCTDFGNGALKNLNCQYVTLSKNITHIDQNAFNGSTFDSVLICNVIESGYFGKEFDFSSNSFTNCSISTYILNRDVTIFDCDGNFSVSPGFSQVNADPKVFYVCETYKHPNDLTKLESYGFSITTYAYDDYENIINEVYR